MKNMNEFTSTSFLFLSYRHY